MKGLAFSVVCACLSLTPAIAATHGGLSPSLTLTDYQPYSNGSYFAFVAPFGKGSFRYGRDYTESLTINAGSAFGLGPTNATLSWSWPTNGTGDVYSFLALDYGNYDNTTPKTPISPVQIANLSTLSQTHSVSIGGTTTGFDVITDFFLTTASGNLSTKVNEVEIFYHSPAYIQNYMSFACGQTNVGTYTDANNQAGKVCIYTTANGGTAPDIVIAPTNNADLFSNTVDLAAMLRWLVTQGTVSNSLWFNGLAFGVEVNQQSGSAAIAAFSVNYH